MPQISFEKIKDLLVERTKITIMNEKDQLILYKDANTDTITVVLMQVQAGIEKPRVPCSIGTSVEMEIMELELYVFVYCVKHLSPYYWGKIIVRTNHKNLVYKRWLIQRPRSW